MNMLLLYVLPVLLSISFAREVDPDTGLNACQMLESHDYVCENHQITTEDGYILTYQRIPNPNSTKKPVLLMHGAGSSSEDYVSMGPNRGLAYILADLGYEVWLANVRGNSWSRNHTTLNIETEPEKFFDYSWHEMGYYDLPAAIDYILGITDQDGLYYVGYSVGTTVFLTMASTRPEYNDKIKLASLMAPIATIEHPNSPILSIVGQYIDEFGALLNKYKIYEVPFVGPIRALASNLCSGDFFGLCKTLIFTFVGADDAEFDQEKVPVIFTNLPSNTAMKPFYHLGQLIKNGGFSQYDHGAEENMKIYGSEKPPAYDLSQISAPVALYYGENDLTADKLDVASLITKLPNVANDYKVPYEQFNHIDFIWAIDAKSFLYDELIKVMETY